MGTTFGKSDKNATNDLSAAGDVVATGTGVKTVADPNRGLTDEQVRNRKLLGIGGRGLGAFSNPSDSPANPVTFTFANNQPQVTPPINDPYNYLAPKTRNPFFG